jgi:hypothetical protein
VDGDLYIPEDSLRFLYYPETYNEMMGGWDHWTPTVWFDGVEEVTDTPFEGIDSTRTLYRQKIQDRLAVPSPVTIALAVDYGARGDTGTVQVEVIAVDSIAFQGLALRLAVTESQINYPKGIRHQVLRDYFPDETGIPLTVAQDDTFAHSQPIVIAAGWAADHCQVVAFVQDDTTREVLQAAQAPVIAASPPAPAAVSDLTVTLSGDDLLLAWSPVTVDTGGAPITVDGYRVYRDTVSIFNPGPVPLDSTAVAWYLDDDGVVGNTGTHYYYRVTAVAGGKTSDPSGAVGEIDRYLSSGK